MDNIPVVLPHYERRGDQVFFLICRDPVLSLTASDIQLFDAIDGKRSRLDLMRYSSSADLRLQEWSDKRAICWVPADQPQRSKKHLLVIEPHMDDAVLSVGGTLLKKAEDISITILSIVKWSTFTSYEYAGRSDFSDIYRVTRLRIEESRIAAQMIGAEHLALDEYDAPLLPFVRTDGTVDQVGIRSLLNEYPEKSLRRKTQWLAGQALGLYAAETKRIESRLRKTLEALQPDEVWIPLGIGHFDHFRTRRACLGLLASAPGWFSRSEIVFYEEVPYNARCPQHAQRLEQALTDLGAQLQRRTEDISDVYERKVDVLAAYASQWKVDRIRPKVPPLETFLHFVSPPEGWRIL